MKHTLVVLLFAFALTGLTAYASGDSLVGKYNGTFTIPSGLGFGISIIIASVDADGKNVKGSVVFYGKICAGTFQLEGIVAGQEVSLTSNSTPDCEKRKFDLRLDGNKLSGKMLTGPGNLFDIEVSK